MSKSSSKYMKWSFESPIRVSMRKLHLPEDCNMGQAKNGPDRVRRPGPRSADPNLSSMGLNFGPELPYSS